MSPVRIYLEIAPKKVFAGALDWPGWCRSGRDEAAALAAFVTAAPRYGAVAALAGHPLPTGAVEPEVAERLDGDASTTFGVPGAIAVADRTLVDGPTAARLASLVEAAWSTFDRVAAAAPAELRKGPRGGGRDTAKVVAHVVAADHAYAREIGVRLRPPAADDRGAIEAERAAMLAVLRGPSDGRPLADRRWPLRYAARRIAWHALDHAWEIEDRTDPAT
jgi:hypothetical protein